MPRREEFSVGKMKIGGLEVCVRYRARREECVDCGSCAIQSRLSRALDQYLQEKEDTGRNPGEVRTNTVYILLYGSPTYKILCTNLILKVGIDPGLSCGTFTPLYTFKRLGLVVIIYTLCNMN